MRKMKLIISMVVFAVVICGAGLATGCAGSAQHVSATSVYAGDDTLYWSEKVITASHDQIKKFLQWELKYRQVLPKEVSQAADFIRLNEKKWIDSANAAHDAYVATPTDQGKKDALMLSVNLISTAIDQALLYQTTYVAQASAADLKVEAIAKPKALTPPTPK